MHVPDTAGAHSHNDMFSLGWVHYACTQLPMISWTVLDRNARCHNLLWPKRDDQHVSSPVTPSLSQKMPARFVVLARHMYHMCHSWDNQNEC